MKELRRFTIARVGLGRAGNSVPVKEMLDFQLAHARARDAVHLPFEAHSLAKGLDGLVVKSAVRDRAEYLRRPDLGRCLSSDSRLHLEKLHGDFDCALIIADGLSPLAVHKHAAGLVRALLPRLHDWTLAPLVIVAGQSGHRRRDWFRARGGAFGNDDRRTAGPQLSRQSRRLCHLGSPARPFGCGAQLHFEYPRRGPERRCGRGASAPPHE